MVNTCLTGIVGRVIGYFSHHQPDGLSFLTVDPSPFLVLRPVITLSFPALSLSFLAVKHVVH